MNNQTNRLYVGWQSPEDKTWHCIGELSRDELGTSVSGYCFRYLRGAQTASGFGPLAGLPDLFGQYCSDQLFGVFTTRLMPQGRPDRPQYLKWLRLGASDGSDPIEELARGGGIRSSDSIQLFPAPTKHEGRYQTQFFAHGLSHQDASAILSAQRLHEGDLLRLVPEPDNQHDGCAIAIQTGAQRIGFVPRFLSCDIGELLRAGDAPLSVEAVNTDAPLSHRLLCRFSAPWPDGFEPFNRDEFQPLAAAV